jgi:hypothetical protein
MEQADRQIPYLALPVRRRFDPLPIKRIGFGVMVADRHECAPYLSL